MACHQVGFHRVVELYIQSSKFNEMHSLFVFFFFWVTPRRLSRGVVLYARHILFGSFRFEARDRRV